VENGKKESNAHLPLSMLKCPLEEACGYGDGVLPRENDEFLETEVEAEETVEEVTGEILEEEAAMIWEKEEDIETTIGAVEEIKEVEETEEEIEVVMEETEEETEVGMVEIEVETEEEGIEDIILLQPISANTPTPNPFLLTNSSGIPILIIADHVHRVTQDFQVHEVFLRRIIMEEMKQACGKLVHQAQV